jgi:DNA-binding transcriptional LysR family regulator
MKVELDQVVCFSAVATELSFSKAAVKLNIDQSRVSRSVRQLETRIGYPLFERTTRSVALTAAGRHLLVEAERIAVAKARFEHTIDQLQEREGKSRRIGALVSRLRPSQTALLETARERFPSITFFVEYDISPSLIERLRDGEFDLVFSYQPQDGTGLHAIPCHRNMLMAVIPDNDPLASAGPLRLDRLGEWTVRLLSPNLQPGMRSRIYHELAAGGAATNMRAGDLPVFSFTPTPRLCQLTFSVPPELTQIRSGLTAVPVEGDYWRDSVMVRRAGQRDPVLDWLFEVAARLNGAL